MNKQKELKKNEQLEQTPKEQWIAEVKWGPAGGFSHPLSLKLCGSYPLSLKLPRLLSPKPLFFGIWKLVSLLKCKATRFYMTLAKNIPLFVSDYFPTSES